jgi:integrase
LAYDEAGPPGAVVRPVDRKCAKRRFGWRSGSGRGGPARSQPGGALGGAPPPGRPGLAPRERRYLTRAELLSLLDELPVKWRTLVELLAATGLFPGRDGRPSDQGSLRRRVLLPAAERAGINGVGFHTLRHTCASMLIESGLSPFRPQRWMGDHSPAFTLDTYGHLIDGDLGPPLDLRRELANSPGHDG